jgi:predicted porin
MNFNRRAMVLAVGAALAAPGAYAQVKSKAGTDWEFYGKFYPEITRLTGDDPTPAGTPVATLAANPTGRSGFTHRSEMEVSNSYIGFRGSKNFGNNFTGIWQLESAVAIDQGDGDPLGNRDSFVGLTSPWFGTIRLGNMDTPFKKAGDALGFLGVSSGNFVSTSNVMRKVGFNNNSASSFHLRRANAVDFTSVDFFGGLTFGAQYSTGNPDEGTSITADPPRNPRVASMALKWERGPFYAAAMYEAHFDMFGGSSNSPSSRQNTTDPNVNSKDTAGQIALVYKLGNHSFEADYIAKDYKENGENSGVNGRFQNYKNGAYQLVWEGRWSPQWRTAVHYIKASAGSCQVVNQSCSTDGLDATQISVGLAYYLDPSFSLFALYSVIDNGKSARYENMESGRPGVGEDITQYAFGISYSF